MTLSLVDVISWAQVALWSGFLVFLRIGAILALAPAFGEQSVPIRLRLCLALAFTLIVLPAASPFLPAPPTQMQALMFLVSVETLNGLLFGVMLRFFVLALQIAGSIAAQSTSLSQLFGGGVGTEPQPVIGHILIVAGLALVAILELHVRLAAFMIQTYDLIAPGVLPGKQAIADVGLREVSHCFGLAFTLAAPFIIASLIYNVTLGAINRAMPQLMVSFVGAPAITAGSLILLLLAAPTLLTVWQQAFFTFMNNPFGPLP